MGNMSVKGRIMKLMARDEIAHAWNAESTHGDPDADKIGKRRIAGIDRVAIVILAILPAEFKAFLLLLIVAVVFVDFLDGLLGERGAHRLRRRRGIMGRTLRGARGFSILVVLGDNAQ